MYKFIYVFSKKISEEFVAQGYNLIKGDDARGIYVFENLPDSNITFSSKEYVLSNTLTF